MQFWRNKTFIALFATLAATALLLVLIFRPAGTDKWEAMKKHLDRLQIEVRSRKLPREVLRGQASPGNAWEEYDIAVNDANTWREDENGGLFLRYVNRVGVVDRAKVEQMVAAHMQAINHLRLGTQRSDGQYPYNWQRGTQMAFPSLLGSRRVTNVAVAQARIWTDSGRPQDAADLLLDVSVFARDLSTNGPLLANLIGLAVYSTVLDEFRNLILSGKLTPKQLADLAKKLEILDHDFPTLSATFANETLSSGTALMEAAEGGEALGQWKELVKEAGWRFAVYPRSTMGEAFEEKEAYMRRAEKLDQMSYAAAKKETGAISTEAAASRNAFVRGSTPGFSRIVEVHHETLAHLRLLRAGTTFLATGKVPLLADPFGDNLSSKQENGKSKVWSIGIDGKDQNGVGNWEKGKPDIVLEIR